MTSQVLGLGLVGHGLDSITAPTPADSCIGLACEAGLSTDA